MLRNGKIFWIEAEQIKQKDSHIEKLEQENLNLKDIVFSMKNKLKKILRSFTFYNTGGIKYSQVKKKRDENDKTNLDLYILIVLSKPK